MQQEDSSVSVKLLHRSLTDSIRSERMKRITNSLISDLSHVASVSLSDSEVPVWILQVHGEGKHLKGRLNH